MDRLLVHATIPVFDGSKARQRLMRFIDLCILIALVLCMNAIVSFLFGSPLTLRGALIPALSYGLAGWIVYSFDGTAVYVYDKRIETNRKTLQTLRSDEVVSVVERSQGPFWRRREGLSVRNSKGQWLFVPKSIPEYQAIKGVVERWPVAENLPK